MKTKFFSYPQISLFIISTSFCIYLLGFDNLNFSNQSWLINGDLAQYQLGWKFYREDIWRFPLGLNPNYGISNGSSIIYSDSIPLCAIFLKYLEVFYLKISIFFYLDLCMLISSKFIRL